jgi:hypothetical protein
MFLLACVWTSGQQSYNKEDLKYFSNATSNPEPKDVSSDDWSGAELSGTTMDAELPLSGLFLCLKPVEDWCGYRHMVLEDGEVN